MEVTHEVALAIAHDAVPQDMVVHAAADVDGIDLDVPVVREGGADVRNGGVEQQRAAMETPRGQRGDLEDRWHAVPFRGAGGK
jgi:hypothetical protein